MHHISYQPHRQANVMLSSTGNYNNYVDVGFQGCAHVVRVLALAERTLIDCPLCAGTVAGEDGEDTLLDSVSPFGTAVLPRPLLRPSNNSAYHPPPALAFAATHPTLVSQQLVVVSDQPRLSAVAPTERAPAASSLHSSTRVREAGPNTLPPGSVARESVDALWQLAFEAVNLGAQLLRWSIRRMHALSSGGSART